MSRMVSHRIIFRWRTVKERLAILLYLTIAVIVEYLLVKAFMLRGLIDESPLLLNISIPATELTITIQISLIFHLIPAAAILSLILSWAYMTASYVINPARVKSLKPKKMSKRSVKRRSSIFRGYFKPLRKFYRRVRWRLGMVDQSLSSSITRLGDLLGINRLSSILEKSPLAKATIKGAITITLTFTTIFIIIYLMEYPKAIYELAINLYQSNPSLLDFVYKTHESAKAMVQPSSPLGWLTSPINNALLNTAPSFKRFMDQLINPLANILSKLDILSKYVLCQNLAAWSSAIIALIYRTILLKLSKT